jgi:hypothetical protein
MAQNFDYTRSWLSEADFPLLGFTRNWENPSDYPTVEPDEGQVRRDMQSLHDEVKDYLNTVLIPKVIAEDATLDAWQAQETAHAEAEQGRVIAEQARAEAEQGRVESMEQIQEESEEVFQLVEKLAVAVNTLSPGTTATAVVAVDPATGGYKITFGIPRGRDGRDGDGRGDMEMSVYDPKGKRTDVFQYVDDALANLPPSYTYGTEDLDAGVTPLESGKLHFVYE